MENLWNFARGIEVTKNGFLMYTDVCINKRYNCNILPVKNIKLTSKVSFKIDEEVGTYYAMIQKYMHVIPSNTIV